MKDVFYTILVIWVIWRILSSLNTIRSKNAPAPQKESRKEGETTVDYIPPKKRSIKDDEGEYVDYEEIE